MLKIWGRHNSSNVRKVLWCAEEIGLPYESIEVGGAFGGTQTPEYRQMNPNGLVPVIEDHGLPLWESNAIVRYLSARYALGTLYPEDPARRAQSEKWMDWTISSFAVAFRDLFWGVVRTAPADRDAARIDAALVRCGDCWRWPTPSCRGNRGCPGRRSRWATSRSARSRMPGSRCRCSARSCRTWPAGTRACSSVRPTARA